jgi:RNA recognition motif-containing protein
MRLFICNLAWEATADDLKNWLSAEFGYQVTEVKVIMHNETGRSRGFGFADFPIESEGQSALRDLDGADFMGRPLKVNLATRKESRRPNSSPSRSDRGRQDDTSSQRRDRRTPRGEWSW